MAEGIFLHRAAHRNMSHLFEVDSAGTGSWHVGSRPDPRAIATASKYGIELLSVARQVTQIDIDQYDLLLAMDSSNLVHLENMGARNARLIRSFESGTGSDLDVPDPYYGDGDGFDRVYEMLVASCDGLICSLTKS
ncbi:MAG: low molecular weight phosphotyrosine protein phosphatase [Phycisphaera sp.]|nr:MAG: low molecular weight phosphotyrosine protein phosphatase [Phycisphaera sp.]